MRLSWDYVRKFALNAAAIPLEFRVQLEIYRSWQDVILFSGAHRNETRLRPASRPCPLLSILSSPRLVRLRFSSRGSCQKNPPPSPRDTRATRTYRSSAFQISKLTSIDRACHTTIIKQLSRAVSPGDTFKPISKLDRTVTKLQRGEKKKVTVFKQRQKMLRFEKKTLT